MSLRSHACKSYIAQPDVDNHVDGWIACITGIDCIADGIHSIGVIVNVDHTMVHGDVTWSQFEVKFSRSQSKVNTC